MSSLQVPSGSSTDAASGSNSPNFYPTGVPSSANMGGVSQMDMGGPTHMQLSNEEKEAREQDRLLPIANISRIMKKVLPDHAKMSKEAKAALQECVSEFIGFITSEASDRLMEEKRKTITGDDIIDSMRALGFDSYMEFLQSYLKRYRQSNKPTKTTVDKPLPPGAHKRGRKARGGDDDDDINEHSTSPINLPTDNAAHLYPSSSSMPIGGLGAQSLHAGQMLAQSSSSSSQENDVHANKRRKG